MAPITLPYTIPNFTISKKGGGGGGRGGGGSSSGSSGSHGSGSSSSSSSGSRGSGSSSSSGSGSSSSSGSGSGSSSSSDSGSRGSGTSGSSSTGSGRPGYGGPGYVGGVWYPYSAGGTYYSSKNAMNWHRWGRWLFCGLICGLFVIILLLILFFKRKRIAAWWAKRRQSKDQWRSDVPARDGDNADEEAAVNSTDTKASPVIDKPLTQGDSKAASGADQAPPYEAQAAALEAPPESKRPDNSIV